MTNYLGSDAEFHAVPATDITYTATGTGAVARTQSSKDGDIISAADYGFTATATSTANTTALQKAINATPYGATLFIPAGFYNHKGGYTRTTPITIAGAGAQATQLIMDASVSSTTDVFPFTPLVAGAGWGLRDIGFVGHGGSQLGRHILHLDTSTTSVAAAYNFTIERVDAAPTLTGNSIFVQGASTYVGAVNGGGFFNSRIKDCNLESISLNLVGDSIEIDGGSCNAAATSNPCIFASQVQGAGNLVIGATVNLSGLNGHIIIDSGVAPVVFAPEIETPAGANAYGYLVDFRGGVDSIWAPQLINSQIQITASLTGSAPIPVRFNNCTNPLLAGGRIGVHTAGNHVLLTSFCSGAIIAGTTQAVVGSSVRAGGLAVLDQTTDGPGGTNGTKYGQFYTAKGIPWTPTDQSGASLVFTSVNTQYAISGNMVTVYGTLTYPTTADGSNAIISLPVAVPNQSYAVVYAPVGGGMVRFLKTVQNSSTAAFFGTGGTAIPNSTLSASTLNFILSYPAS